MANLRSQKKAETSARLLAAARKSFFELGYAATSMDKLCASAGVTRGALYHNFGGKDGLFEAVVQEINDEMVERLLAMAGDDASLDTFVRVCRSYLTFALDPEIQRIVFQDAPAVLGQRLRDIDAQGSIVPLTDAIADLIDGNIFPDIDPTALAVLLNGAMIDAALWIASQPDKAHSLESAAHALEQLIRQLAGESSQSLSG
ncbi:TetR/AcrR family transcriptional regulator [Leptothoe sp. LEGE 181152]|uniref:TetR/AcrR family transcriptional regulator n=1 Tax=Adonisia turfae CCMR0081 TaxID=2292702 RepID=A0A6M0RDM7_9CYAN|nr:TetR/AcrR family transcriptional regulator [Adonisia turfae]MDV3349171.1 TetR/AcrR family transcriptional regulator [Leptothoe sp. LEGE 181152]NEZ54384.1 TetR/AcrR family transcriptional regulator [Adonisia turfae CCMR0081]